MKAYSYDAARLEPKHETQAHNLPNERLQEERQQEEPRKAVKILQQIGAVVVAASALWFLFGIPAYLLFGTFFD